MPELGLKMFLLPLVPSCASVKIVNKALYDMRKRRISLTSFQPRLGCCTIIFPASTSVRLWLRRDGKAPAGATLVPARKASAYASVGKCISEIRLGLHHWLLDLNPVRVTMFTPSLTVTVTVSALRSAAKADITSHSQGLPD